MAQKSPAWRRLQTEHLDACSPRSLLLWCVSVCVCVFARPLKRKREREHKACERCACARALCRAANFSRAHALSRRRLARSPARNRTSTAQTTARSQALAAATQPSSRKARMIARHRVPAAVATRSVFRLPVGGEHNSLALGYARGISQFSRPPRQRTTATASKQLAVQVIKRTFLVVARCAICLPLAEILLWTRARGGDWPSCKGTHTNTGHARSSNSSSSSSQGTVGPDETGPRAKSA